MDRLLLNLTAVEEAAEDRDQQLRAALRLLLQGVLPLLRPDLADSGGHRKTQRQAAWIGDGEAL
jgi:hypothetical protein